MTVKLRQFSVAGVIIFLHAFSSFPVAAEPDTGKVTGFAGPDVCLPVEISVPRTLWDASGRTADGQPVTIEADQMEASVGQEIVFLGNASIRQGNRAVYADAIIYNPETLRAGASGNVVLYTPAGDEIRAETMDLEVDTFIGDAEKVSIRIADTIPGLAEGSREGPGEDRSNFTESWHPADAGGQDPGDTGDGANGNRYHQQARVDGETMQFEGREIMILRNAEMTTCPDGKRDITLAAKVLRLDKAAGIGTATAMTVRLKNVPVLYFPSISFPIDNRRKSGFLFPSIGEERESGVILDLPYYINIAPHMDATITPRIMTERGVQLSGEFRYMGKRTDGALRAEYLPSDDLSAGEDRYTVQFDHDQDFGDRWEAKVDLVDVSDPAYPRDFFGSTTGPIARGYVAQRSRLSRFGERFELHISTLSQDPINDRTSGEFRPHDIQPEIGIRMKPGTFGIFRGGIRTNFARFSHEEETRTDGSRTLVHSFVSVPVVAPYGSIEPRISLYNLKYSLDKARNHAPSASVPAYSLDGKLAFERLFEAGGGSFYQTLEPRLFYVKIPRERDQSTLPIFDTDVSQPTSYSHFFRENRFTGGDRVGDTEQISLGLTSRVMDDNTRTQRMKFSVGQVYYLKDRYIGLNSDDRPLTDDRSGLFTEMTANFNEEWSMTGFALWEKESNDPDVIWLSADYDHDRRRNASIAYTAIYDDAEQVRMDFSAPLGPRWQFDADTAYSLEDHNVRSSSLRLSYDGCCWVTRLEYQRYLDGTGEFRNRILFTLELDDLGRIRSGLGSRA